MIQLPGITRDPVFKDNIDILEGSEKLCEIQAEQKVITQKYKMVQADIKDTENSNTNALANCEKDYLDNKEFLKFYKEFYCTAQILYRACTEKQKMILLLLFVEEKRLFEMVEILDIKHNSILQHMKLIKIKSEKLNLKLNLTGG